MTAITNTYQMSSLSQMSTDINKALQATVQTIIREGANRNLFQTPPNVVRAFSFDTSQRQVQQLSHGHITRAATAG